MKRFSCLVFVLCMLLSIACYAESMVVDVKNGERLNGRAEPKKGSEILCYFYRGDCVNVLEVKNGWAKLDEGGEASTSWVSLDFLRDDLDEETQMRVTANGRVKVRKNPNGKVIDYVHNGDIVDIFCSFEGWGRTKRGWIDMEYLTFE